MPFYAADIKSAQSHLAKADPIMKAIIQRVGPFTARARRDRFRTLVRSIISQQISGAAAQTILGRLEALIAPEKIQPDTLARFDIEDLRTVGLSRQKATYTLDLANKVQAGTVDLAVSYTHLTLPTTPYV